MKNEASIKKIQWNLDSLKIPTEVETLFPNKAALFSKMRALEHDMKSFLKAKVLNIKEDILAGNASVKRTLKILVEVNPRLMEDSWVVRIEGRVDDNAPEVQKTKLLNVFERVKVEFAKKDGQAPYLPI